MKITISHEFNTDPDTFWAKIFLDKDFNQKLYRDELKMIDYTVIEEVDTDATLRRRLRVTPRQEAPAVIQKLIGGNLTYVEEGTFDKAAKKYKFKVIPGSLADKVRTEGEMRAESIGPKKMRRVVEMIIEVKIFGVGGMVEAFISKSTQDSYTKAAAFTNRWIADNNL